MNTEKNSGTLAALEINPAKPAVASLIWLHGLGASNDDFVPIAAELHQLTGLSLRFVFPQAPLRPVTINNGYVMPAWFDIFSFDKNGKIDQDGISAACQQIKSLMKIEKEKGFNADKIFLAGFSQGAVIALNTLLTYPDELGGVIALSGYLPLQTLPASKHPTPIFIGHGQADKIVPCVYGQAAGEKLKEAGYPVTWRTYPMPHSVCDREIHDLATWLQERFS